MIKDLLKRDEGKKYLAHNVCFDELPHVRGKISDLDWDAMKKLFLHVHKTMTVAHARSMGLLVQEGTREYSSFGGIILFGRKRLEMFPEAIIRCACFLGNDRETILDQQDIVSYVPFALEQAVAFVQRNTRQGAEIRSLARKDVSQYPPLAVREALINALVHADYAIKGVYISIAIFDDRMEITNPGGLPFGFTLEKALAGSSRIRNRVIAKVFYQLKWIEQWGRGLQLIVKECAKRGLMESKFEELNNQFRVTLYGVLKKQTAISSDQTRLVNYLKKKKKVRTKQAAALWHVTTRTARLRLIKLVAAGVIQKTGTSLQDPRSAYVLRD